MARQLQGQEAAASTGTAGTEEWPFQVGGSISGIAEDIFDFPSSHGSGKNVAGRGGCRSGSLREVRSGVARVPLPLFYHLWANTAVAAASFIHRCNRGGGAGSSDVPKSYLFSQFFAVENHFFLVVVVTAFWP